LLISALQKQPLVFGIHPRVRFPRNDAQKKKMVRIAAKGWQVAEMGVYQLAGHLDAGGCLGPVYREGRRLKENVETIAYIAVDLDNGPNVDTVMQHPLVKRFECVVGATTSNTLEQPRTRVFFLLNAPASPEEHAKAARIVLYQFRDWKPDSSSDQASRMYLGFQVGTTMAYPGERLTSEAIRTLPAPPPPAPTPRKVAPLMPVAGNLSRAQRWHQENVATVHTAVKGDRNDTLFYQACCSFELVAGGQLSEAQVRADFIEAGIAVGLGRSEVRNTVNSAYEHGMKNPRQAGAYHPVKRSMSSDQVWWASGVPDSVRTTLLTFCRPSVAPVVELLNRAFCLGALNPAVFAFQDFKTGCHKQGYLLSKSTLNDAFHELRDVLIRKLNPDEVPEEVVNSRINSKRRGRPEDFYAVLPLEDGLANLLVIIRPQLEQRVFERALKGRKLTVKHLQVMGAEDEEAKQFVALLKHLNHGDAEELLSLENKVRDLYQKLEKRLTWTKSTPLAGGMQFRNGKEYRAAYLRGIVEADPETPRKNGYLCWCLGASKNTVLTTMKLAYVMNVPQYTPPEPLVADIAFDEQLKPSTGRYAVALCWDEEGKQIERRFDYRGQTRKAGRNRWAQGQEVCVIWQTASRQVLYELGSEQFQQDMLPKQKQQRRKGRQQRGRRELYDLINAQMLLRQLFLYNGWVEAGNWLRNLETGEVVSNDTSPLTMVRRLLQAQPDPLTLYAVQTWGAEVWLLDALAS
jgi:hypothetical protein